MIPKAEFLGGNWNSLQRETDIKRYYFSELDLNTKAVVRMCNGQTILDHVSDEYVIIFSNLFIYLLHILCTTNDKQIKCCSLSRIT